MYLQYQLNHHELYKLYQNQYYMLLDFCLIKLKRRNSNNTKFSLFSNSDEKIECTGGAILFIDQEACQTASTESSTSGIS